LSEDEFFSMTPFRFYLMQIHSKRKIERAWEQTREIVTMVHNMAMGQKKQLKPRNFIKLSFDRQVQREEWTQEDALNLIKIWPDIKPDN